jgi:hypothetical protein
VLKLSVKLNFRFNFHPLLLLLLSLFSPRKAVDEIEQLSLSRVARFLLIQYTKTEKNIPTCH